MDQPGSVDDYAETLNKLRISQSRGSAKPSKDDQEDENTEPKSKMEQSPETKNRTKEEGEPQDETFVAQDLRASPSPFATLITATKSPDTTRLLSVPDPITNIGTFDFSGPSPDDLYTKAQSKSRG